MSKVNQKEIMTSFMDEVWNAGDFSNLSQYISATYEVIDDPGDAWNGKELNHEEFIERVMYSRNAFQNLNFDIQEMIDGDEKTAIRWKMSGEHTGDIPMIPASNKKFCISGMTFYYFKNGKISGHRQAFDRLGFIQQINAFG
ncbi:ester cyclase [Shewanella chilikensis]|uniref:ester cyclase n=1 Tax=Shewanella chilikensis TaxID=558541 RepID=UPI00399B0CD4